MKTRILAGAVIACAIALPAITTSAAPAASGAANPAECANLTTLKLPDAKVTEAAAVPAGATGTVRVPHCRVAGVIGKEIRFSLLMPDEWNHKFLMGGGGGFVGTVQNQAQSVVELCDDAVRGKRNGERCCDCDNVRHRARARGGSDESDHDHEARVIRNSRSRPARRRQR